jgi:hypothetical protein
MTYILFFKMAEFKGRVFFDIFFAFIQFLDRTRALKTVSTGCVNFFFWLEFRNFFKHFFKR